MIESQAEEKAFTDALVKITWPISYGQVKIQLRAGKPAIVTVERTIKLD